MLKFNDIVSSVLLEQPQPTPGTLPPGAPLPPQTNTLVYPDWFKGILNVHEKLGLGKVSDSDLRNIFNIVFKTYVSEQDAKTVGKNIRILDVLKTIYDGVKIKPGKTQKDFFNSTNKTANNQIKNLGVSEYNTIAQFTNKKQWELQNAQVANAYKAVEPTTQGIVSKVAGALGALRVGMGPVG